MSTDIRVPTLGESVTEATVASWFKKEGEAVEADEVLAELETDKVSVEVRAPVAGVLSAIKAQAGDTVEVDGLIGEIAEGAGAPATNGAGRGGNGQEPKEAGGAVQTSAAPSGGATIAIEVPTLGESVTEATISSWLKRQGDAVEADEIIAELETDKVSVEVRAPVAGVLSTISASEGDTVEVGAVIGEVASGASAAPQTSEAKASDTKSASPSAAKPAAVSRPAAAGDTLSPAVRRIVAEHNLDPSTIKGTGKDGRLTKEDALKAASGERPAAHAPSTESLAIPAAPTQAKAPAGAPGAPTGPLEERVPMTRLRQTIARRLKEAQDTAAMLTTFNEVDMSAVMDLRKRTKELFERKHGVKLGFMSFFVKACIVALKDIPAVNAEIDGTDLVYKNYYHIGVAVGTERGLVVPVVRDADQMSLAEIEKTIGSLGAKARDGELSIADLQGGTFTISNGGVYGSLMSTPILNSPQSGILGMHKIQERPIVVDGKMEVRPMMYLALSYDHRIIDGREAVTFLVRVKDSLESPERMLLDL
ncbi:MAG: 2-oxoglutarate dehydrogenase complex dihydrolipoyllysine-residue succinyltransferase [Pseudomonadota bacterium]